MKKPPVLETLLQIRKSLDCGEKGADPDTLELELLREMIHCGTLRGDKLTHRELVTPRVKTLLDAGKYSELHSFLEEYIRLSQKR